MVRCVRGLVVLGLVFALATQASAAGTGKGKGRSGAHPVFGVVESVSGGSLTVKVHARKNRGGAASDRTFTLNGSTKYSAGHARGKGGKGNKGGTASAGSLKKGTRVLVFAKGGVAERVVVMHGHHGKGKGKGKAGTGARNKSKKAA